MAKAIDPVIDPDCRAGKHATCAGDPCECVRHSEREPLSYDEAANAEHDRP